MGVNNWFICFVCIEGVIFIVIVDKWRIWLIFFIIFFNKFRWGLVGVWVFVVFFFYVSLLGFFFMVNFDVFWWWSFMGFYSYCLGIGYIVIIYIFFVVFVDFNNWWKRREKFSKIW